MFFVMDENHNLIEAYDKEGVLAVLAQAIADGSLSGITADAGFIKKIQCCVTGQTNQIAFVTTAKYNELVAQGLIKDNCLYYITDDTSAEDLDNLLEELTQFKSDVLSGKTKVDYAKKADDAINAQDSIRAKYANNSGCLSAMETIEGYKDAYGTWVCDITKTGIYVAVNFQEYGSFTGILCITDMGKGGNDTEGYFTFNNIKSHIELAKNTNYTTAFKVYRIANL